MRLVRALVYLATCVYLVLVLPGAGEVFARAGQGLWDGVVAGAPQARAFAAAALLFVPLAWLLRSRLGFWYALSHEISHSLAAILLGGHPDELQAHASGSGRVTFGRSPAVIWVVLLAPYVLSPAHLAPLLVPWLSEPARVWGAAAGGAATAFALVSNGLQIRAYQSDIRSAGLLRSLLFIAWGNLAVAGCSTLLSTGRASSALAGLGQIFVPAW